MLGVKNGFLLLKSSTLEHTLAKRISSEIYTPKEGEWGTSSSRNKSKYRFLIFASFLTFSMKGTCLI